MIVYKFGGTSLGSAELLREAAALVATAPAVVVVSAMGGTTDRLLEAAHAAEEGDAARATALVDEIRARHGEVVEALQLPLADELAALLGELSALLEGVQLLRERTPRSQALIASMGERLCAPLFAALLTARDKPAVALDARELVVTSSDQPAATVEHEPTARRCQARLQPLLDAGRYAVVTGFIGADEQGITTTLGRGGSDLTATVLGSALGADEICIFTDVDGVLTADPRLVKEARTLPAVSYREAAEMSYFGARVLHPRTIQPAARAGIPVRVRGTFTPDNPGTLIQEHAPTLPQGVKTVTSIDGQALVTLDGRGMAGVPGVARRIFEASELAGVNVVMISQASSEQTVSLVVPIDAAARLRAALRERFAPELSRGAIEQVTCDDPVSIVSIIGQGMAGTPGIAGRLFGALGQARVNVLAIAQGASELSISVVVRSADVRRAVRAAHTAFGLTRVVHLLLLGGGRVAGALLRLLEQTRGRLADSLDLELRLVGLANTSRLLLDADGIDPRRAITRLRQAGAPRPTDGELIEALAAAQLSDVVLVDATAAATAALQRAALAAGCHVVTANKLPLAGAQQEFDELRATGRRHGASYHYETTFGAGLPVLHTLSELLDTGDRVRSIAGCLSGTLGYIASELDGGRPLREIVAEAERRGYTEPDPREDLGGHDVARKALIIARSCGLQLEPAAIAPEPLVPGLERGLDAACAAFQQQLSARLDAARARGEVLRYVAEIRPLRREIAVGLREVPADSPLGALRGPDNMLVFHTDRYDEFPLVIRGPGAGAEVTAAGVLGDVLKIARRTG